MRPAAYELDDNCPAWPRPSLLVKGRRGPREPASCPHRFRRLTVETITEALTEPPAPKGRPGTSAPSLREEVQLSARFSSLL